LHPQFLDNTMAFMLESSLIWNITEYAAQCQFLQNDYYMCWQDLPPANLS
jgi:homogentisate 1,2-dioxygenase